MTNIVLLLVPRDIRTTVMIVPIFPLAIAVERRGKIQSQKENQRKENHGEGKKRTKERFEGKKTIKVSASRRGL